MPNDPELTLHWTPGTCSRVTLIALEEIGKPFETVLVPRSDPKKMAEYAKSIIRRARSRPS